jgi:hypothetical protein
MTSNRGSMREIAVRLGDHHAAVIGLRERGEVGDDLGGPEGIHSDDDALGVEL